VTIDVPVPAGGTEPRLVEFSFRLLPASKARRLLLEGDAAFLQGVIGGWQNIFSANGSPLPYSAENLDLLADVPYVARAIADAYGRFSQALPGRTSAPRPGTGAADQREATTH
jgi:hypothetical protein